MRKEIILAVIIGLTLGLVLTFGIYRASLALNQQPTNESVSPLPSPSPTTSATTLSLFSPDDESIVTTATVTVAGTTTEQVQVVIFVNDAPQITTSDADGNFSVQVTLDEGSNVIIVHALNEDGSSTVVERTIIKMNTASSSSATTSATTATTTPSATPKSSPKPASSPVSKVTVSPSPKL